MKKRPLLILALLLIAVMGAWAQNGWDAVYHQTQTTSGDWTPLTEGSETGKVLGGNSSAPYYYYVTKSLKFANGTAGGSGLTIKGDVYLYIPTGLTITCNGANASGAKGAGAGIELSEGNTLHIMGCGNINPSGTGDDKWVATDVVVAIGGNAANGVNGETGTDATGYQGDWTQTGTGGKGGDGGGGAGAGIGTRGGNGGSGGSGYKYTDWNEHNGTDGSSGEKGATAGKMGNLYVDQTFGLRVKATGGAAASSGGGAGQRGRGYAWDGAGNNYTVAGGGGGGAGGFGGAASNIGSGGPGGGGGGGGAGGAQDKRSNSKGGVYDVTAYGGKGGKNANDTSAADGAEAPTTGTAQSQGWVTVENGSFSSSDWNPASGDASFGNGGSGGGYGNAAYNGVMNAGQPMEYTITFNPLKTQINGEVKIATSKYSPSSATTVILPKNAEGYQWVLQVYGKYCGADGKDACEYATPTKKYYGSNSDEEIERTILLSDVYGDITFQEVKAICMLKNNGNNTEVLNDFFYNESVGAQSYPVTVRLKDRTLYKDNNWNTICLPFDLTPAQFSASPLAGSLVYKMDEINTGYYPNGQEVPIARYRKDDPVLFLFFQNVQANRKGLERGVPYLVKWSSSTDGDLVDNSSVKGAKKVHQLDFLNVMIEEKIPGSTYANDVSFQGTFSLSENLIAGDQTKLILGAGSKLYYPSENINVGACRAYFIIPEDAVEVVKTRGITMGFDDDDETTGIQELKVGNHDSRNDASTYYYNLNGQRLSAPQKGINIINGKKILVK